MRKTVTVIFSDLAGSTAMQEALDPEAVRRVMERYYQVMRDVVERHSGTVEKFIGDAVVAVFGAPAVREDDAVRAVRCAVVVDVAVRGQGLKAGEHETATGAVYLVEDGLWVGTDFYEPGDRTAMLARFAELSGTGDAASAT